MDSKIKEEIWKIFMVASFLFITIFFILPYLVQVSTFFHERGHQKALDKYGIENSYYINLLETIPNFYNPKVQKLGVTRFDLEAYKKLNKYERTEINIAGIVSDLRFLFLIAIYLSFINVYLFYKIRIKKQIDFAFLLGINWILFMWLVALIQITVSNITFSSGDIYSLVRFLEVI
ncbi:MAG: hypothetical protein WCX73_04525 [Candidatus Pacearchaeota archaeon]|jgi:hypothetical protein